VIEVLAAPGDPATAMLEAVRRLDDEFDAMRDRAPALLEAVVHAIRTESAEVVALWTELRLHLARHIDALREAGAVPPWVDPEPMAALILSVAAGVTVAIAIEPGGPSHRAIAEQFAALLLSAGKT
jgi:hypothetical protein